jgi:hypothetical protein
MAVGLFATPISDAAGLNDTVVLFGRSVSSPFVTLGVSPVALGNSFIGGAGVPLGVPAGVVCVLPTLDFLDPDLGVMLLFKKADIGLAKSSLEDATGGVWWSTCAPLRGSRGVNAACEADAATLGVKGGLLELFAAGAAPSEGITGRFCFSYAGMLFAALPVFAVNGGCRSMALGWRGRKGGRRGGRDGRGGGG